MGAGHRLHGAVGLAEVHEHGAHARVHLHLPTRHHPHASARQLRGVSPWAGWGGESSLHVGHDQAGRRLGLRGLGSRMTWGLRVEGLGRRAPGTTERRNHGGSVNRKPFAITLRPWLSATEKVHAPPPTKPDARQVKVRLHLQVNTTTHTRVGGHATTHTRVSDAREMRQPRTKRAHPAWFSQPRGVSPPRGISYVQTRDARQPGTRETSATGCMLQGLSSVVRPPPPFQGSGVWRVRGLRE